MTRPDVGLAGLAARLRAGEEEIERPIDRLEASFAEREDEVRAFLPEPGRFARLRREARELAARFPEPATRPPLFGVPVAVKDVFRVAGFETRAGSRLPADEFDGPEAVCVTALKRAGALILGKTVSTEFAYFAPGETRNPRNLAHTPGGSSSGSAAAVAAGLAPLALGTQTIGSITRPAAFCGVVGYKPTYDRIPRAGLVPLAPSLDHVGLFTHDAAGAALAASVLCRGWDASAAVAYAPASGSATAFPARPPAAPPAGRAAGPSTAPSAAPSAVPSAGSPAALSAAPSAGPPAAPSAVPSAVPPAASPATRRPVLGVPVGPYLDRVSDAGRAHFDAVRAQLEDAGYAVVEVPAILDFDAVEKRHGVIVAAEAARVHERWFDRHADLYAPETAELVRRGREIPDAELDRALAGRAELRSELIVLMDRQGIDLWISPAAPGPAPRGLESTGSPVMNLPWTHAGLPTLALPAGRDPDDLPMGLQVAARTDADETLFAWAGELETVLH